MRVYSLLFMMFFALSIGANAQVKFFTNVNSKQIKTLQVKVAGELISEPYITLGGEEQIEINFDGLGSGYTRYAYNVVHCNADWTQSQLSPIEYMNGFQGTTIDDFANPSELLPNIRTTGSYFRTTISSLRSPAIMPSRFITRIHRTRSF